MANNNTSNKHIKSILDLLKQGEENLKIDTHKDAVLVLGNTGSGKSTFTYFLAGDNNNLESKEITQGEYIIIDVNGKISINTITSKTIFPELVVDIKTKTAFYDCPGFSDTRSPAHDISATYFTKKIIDSTNSVKLVFVVSYPSVRHGVDRQDFMLLIKHATSIIKNIEKFKDSIALVVTKVDNTIVKQGKDYVLVADEKIIKGIASFIKGVKHELKMKIGLGNISALERSFYKNAIIFIDTLLLQRGQEYTRIGIFRRPDESGVVSEITLLQDGKKSLEKIIYENIQFIAHDERDFSYTISSESKNYVYGLVEEINKSITSNIAGIGQEIEEYYYSQEKESHDIKKLRDKFESGYEIMSKTHTEMAKFTEPRTFTEEIIKDLNKLNIDISSKNLLIILNYDQYLKFLFTVSNQETSRPSEWAQGLTNMIEYLHNSHIWYSFLVNLFDMLSKYDVQEDINKYDVTYLKNQININKNKGIKITEIDFKKFFDQINKEEDNKLYDNIKDIMLDQFKLNALKNVLDLTLNHIVKPVCLSNKLVVKGQYVMISDVTNKIICPEKIKFIEIFALNKVFIDASLDKTGDKLQLSIIAPTWDIIGTQKIVLDGKSGQAHVPVKATSPGKDGKPGLPGGSAGIFFGIGQRFLNGHHLSISANGGKGGPGQHGGDGVNGKDGEVPPVPPDNTPDTWKEDGFNVEEKLISSTCSMYTCNNRYEARVFGKNCIDGQDGGNGGVGGVGGNAGEITIVKQNKDLGILINKSQGESGVGGMGGNSGGRGGKPGEILTVQVRSESTIGGRHRIEYFGSYTVPTKVCKISREGIHGHNNASIQAQEEAIKFLNPSHTVNNYKNYLRENFNRSIRESSLKEFLDQLEDNQEVNELYDTSGFINELQGLENQYYQLHKELSLLPFYKSLLHRISRYADNPKNYERSMEFKKALSYSYTATLSRICSINNNLESNLVINLNEYLSLAINNIKKLKDLRNVVAINEYQKSYQEVINSKTHEAEHFIDTKITPEINNIFIQIDNQIQLLINETITLENESIEEKRRLLRQEKELQDSLVLRKLLGTVKIGSQFLSFLGPVGAAAGAVVGGGIMVTESLALDDSSKQGTDKILALPSALKNSITKITDQLKNKQQIFNLQLYDAKQELAKLSDKESSSTIKDINNKILQTKADMEDEIAKGAILDPASVDRIQTKRKELVELLQNKKEELEKHKQPNDQNIEKQLRIVNNIQNIVGIGEISVDFYSRIRNQQSKIDKLSTSIREVETRITQLEKYEEDIYKIIIPTCSALENRIMALENNLQSKSHVALDISKWQIQSAIKDVKLQMQKMTKGFSVQEDLTRCIEKLEEGMSIMINVYDRIEDYRDKSELADYISDISSRRAMELKVEDAELNKAINKLALIIKSNLVLGQYERAMNAFKQYIFPFAHSYLAEFDSPVSLKLDNSTDILVSNAITQIEHIQSKISESIVTINKYDKYIHNNITFKSTRTKPFFTWQHDLNKATISKLLQGQEVTIKADVTKGINKNAIKFNIIGIHFKFANETIQNEFDEQLQHFEVSMTHLGNSYYRCGNKFYIITSDSQNISYSLNKGEPINTNLVYDKIKSNDLILSPYAMWSIKLNNVSDSFSILTKYKNQAIDLELEGRGQYIDQGIDVCNNNLQNYYRVDDTISEINTIDLYNRQEIISRHQRYRQRKRRSVMKKRDLIKKDTEADSFVTSGTCNNFKFSIINNIFNIIGNSLITLKYLNPINKISKWFIKDESNVDQEALHIIDNYSTQMKLINIQPLLVETPNISNMFIDKDKYIDERINYTLLNVQGNLLLLDLLIRKTNGAKYNDNSVTVNRNIDNEYAHNLAYNAYTPKDKLSQ